MIYLCIFNGAGSLIVANTPEQFAAYQATEHARWGKLITSRNIKAD